MIVASGAQSVKKYTAASQVKAPRNRRRSRLPVKMKSTTTSS